MTGSKRSRPALTKAGRGAAACILLASAFAGGQQAQAAEPRRADAAQAATPVGTVAAFHAALTAGNKAAALALLTEDVLIFESGGVERGRAEFSRHHLEADAAFSAAVQRTLVSRTHDEKADNAWVTSVEKVSGSYRGRAVNNRSLETMLLRRINGSWRITHVHWSSSTKPAG